MASSLLEEIGTQELLETDKGSLLYRRLQEGIRGDKGYTSLKIGVREGEVELIYEIRNEAIEVYFGMDEINTYPEVSYLLNREFPRGKIELDPIDGSAVVYFPIEGTREKEVRMFLEKASELEEEVSKELGEHTVTLNPRDMKNHNSY